MSTFEFNGQMPDCERLSVRERTANFVAKWAARYCTLQMARIIPIDYEADENVIREPLPDYAARGCIELEQFANFPEV